MSSPSPSPDFAFDALLARLALSNPAAAASAAAEAAFVTAALRLKAGAHVVDIPCGTGRHARLLAELGCHVTAIDNSEHCLELARESRVRARLSYMKGDIRALGDVGQPFDALVSLYSFLGYFDGERENDGVFGSLVGLLSPNGRFVVSTANRQWVEQVRERATEFEESGYRVQRHDLIEAATGILIISLQIKSLSTGATFDYRQERRIYSLAELEQRFAAADARIVGSFSTWNGDEFSQQDSPHVILVGERA